MTPTDSLIVGLIVAAPVFISAVFRPHTKSLHFGKKLNFNKEEYAT